MDSCERIGRRRWQGKALPVLTGDPQNQLKEMLSTGWDHEHCELCRASIEVGGYGFSDLRGHWVCEACHAKYVVTHDLSFLYS